MTVSAVISLPSYSGNAPLTLTVDGSDSTTDNGTIVAYSWNLGDGSTSTAETFSHTFGLGNHTITLTAISSTGDTGTATADIVVSLPLAGSVPPGAPGAFFWNLRELVDSYDANHKVIVFPWAWDSDPAPDNYDNFERAANLVADDLGVEFVTLGTLQDQQYAEDEFRNGEILATTAGHKLIASMFVAAGVELLQ